MKYYLCFDIGGSSMKSGLLSREGKIIEKKSYPMTDMFEELLVCMKDFHQMFKDDYELDGVAISSCGSIDVENAVIDAVWALPFLQGIPWREVIQKEFGLHCEIENDANCAALSELYFGEAQDIKDMAFFVIGTGVGGAISQRDDFVERLMEEYNSRKDWYGYHHTKLKVLYISSRRKLTWCTRKLYWS